MVLERDPRCQIISLDPDTGEHNPEVLRKIAQSHAAFATTLHTCAPDGAEPITGVLSRHACGSTSNFLVYLAFRTKELLKRVDCHIICVADETRSLARIAVLMTLASANQDFVILAPRAVNFLYFGLLTAEFGQQPDVGDSFLIFSCELMLLSIKE